MQTPAERVTTESFSEAPAYVLRQLKEKGAISVFKPGVTAGGVFLVDADRVTMPDSATVVEVPINDVIQTPDEAIANAREQQAIAIVDTRERIAYMVTSAMSDRLTKAARHALGAAFEMQGHQLTTYGEDNTPLMPGEPTPWDRDEG